MRHESIILWFTACSMMDLFIILQPFLKTCWYHCLMNSLQKTLLYVSEVNSCGENIVEKTVCLWSVRQWASTISRWALRIYAWCKFSILKNTTAFWANCHTTWVCGKVSAKAGGSCERIFIVEIALIHEDRDRSLRKAFKDIQPLL